MALRRWEPGLAGWLALTTAVLVILAVGSVSLVGTRLLGDLADAEARARAELGVSAAQELLRQELDDLHRAATLLAARPTLQSHLADAGGGEMQTYLSRYCRDAALDACAILGSGHEPDRMAAEVRSTVGAPVNWDLVLAGLGANGTGFIAEHAAGTAPLAAAAVAADAQDGVRVVALRVMDAGFMTGVSESVGLETHLRFEPGLSGNGSDRQVRRVAGATSNEPADYFATAPLPGSSGRQPVVLEVRLHASDVLAPVAALERRMQAIAIGVALLAILCAILVARYWIQGVRRLSAAARHIGAGNLGDPVREERGAEIGVLAANMEQMRMNLLALDGARRVRDTILANISHEFRTPLAAQLASIELLRDGIDTMPTDAQARLVRSLEHGARRLTWLIDNLLESVRIESGELGIRRQPISLADVVAAASETVEPLLDRRGQSIEVDGISQLPAVPGDRQRLTQVLINLLANASKFAPAESTIRIGGDASVGRIRLWVEDEGRGPQDADATLLFEAFRRSAGNDPEESGLGLGLFIVRSIVERHGGRVWLERTADARTQAILELPDHETG